MKYNVGDFIIILDHFEDYLDLVYERTPLRIRMIDLLSNWDISLDPPAGNADKIQYAISRSLSII